jgi:predicted RNase H-related nuclease YkuK (DUF458 family)
MKRWYTGNGHPTTIENIHNTIKQYSKKNGKVYIGSDSFIQKKFCVLSSVICLYSEYERSGGIYFYSRENLLKKDFPTLTQRLIHEATNSIELGMGISEEIPNVKLELHLDVNSDRRAASNKLADSLSGYVKASGFDCKIKPEAWAASTIADKHSK